MWHVAEDYSAMIPFVKVAGEIVDISTTGAGEYTAIGSAVVQVVTKGDKQPNRTIYCKAKDRLMVYNDFVFMDCFVQ